MGLTGAFQKKDIYLEGPAAGKSLICYESPSDPYSEGVYWCIIEGEENPNKFSNIYTGSKPEDICQHSFNRVVCSDPQHNFKRETTVANLRYQELHAIIAREVGTRLAGTPQVGTPEN